LRVCGVRLPDSTHTHAQVLRDVPSNTSLLSQFDNNPTPKTRWNDRNKPYWALFVPPLPFVSIFLTYLFNRVTLMYKSLLSIGYIDGYSYN